MLCTSAGCVARKKVIFSGRLEGMSDILHTTYRRYNTWRMLCASAGWLMKTNIISYDRLDAEATPGAFSAHGHTCIWQVCVAMWCIVVRCGAVLCSVVQCVEGTPGACSAHQHTHSWRLDRRLTALCPRKYWNLLFVISP